MDLRDLLSGKENKNRQFYWALVMEPGWVQAGIWEIIDQKAEVVAISPPAAWETDAELVGAADTALSSCVQNLPEEIQEPTKTIFSIPPSWAEGGKIKEEYLGKIKKICVDLSLEPTGFVVLPESIAHLVKTEEGSPLNAVVVGIGKEFLEIAVFKLGNLLGTTAVSRSVSIFEDVTEGLTRFAQGENLPSRIIVYDGKEGETEEARESLTQAGWENLEKVKFLHTPKIEVLMPEKKVLATALAGASELGGVVGVEKKKDETGLESTFKEEDENVVTPEKNVSAEELGFVMNEDVALTSKEQPKVIPQPQPQPLVEKKKIFSDQISLIKNFFGRVKKIKTKKTLNYGGILLVAGLVIGFFLWWFLPKASVRIYVVPKKFEEKVAVTVETGAASVNLAEKILPAELLETEVSGEKTRATTGTKKVGEKAVGNVKIQNGTATVINLSAGTILVAANDLRFTINKAASVSAALSPSNPGNQTVEITAADIGAEYNLAKDESFKVANYPKADVDATATADFSGGSSREISAVATEDQEALEENLTKELLDQAKKELTAKISVEMVFIDGSLTETPSSKVFSNKVGDEASSLKLALSFKVSGLAVGKENLTELAKQVLQGATPSGFVLRPDQLDFDFSRQEEEEKAVFDLRVIANFLPEIDPVALAKQVSGKMSSSVEESLTTIPGFSRAEIDIKPKFPGRLGSLPRLSKNIKIELLAEH